MRQWLDRFRTQIDWLWLGTIVLALMHLSPLFRTGYLADDAGNSLVHGILRYYGINIFQLLFRDTVAWISQARFYPLASAHIYLVFYLIPTLILYKGFVILLILSNLALFRLLVRRLYPIPGFAELCVLLVLALFQFRIYHDPILAFGGLIQFALLYVLVSLLCLCKYFESARPAWLLASVGTYLLALLTYEITYPLFLLHFLVAAICTRGWVQVLRTGAWFLGAAAACAGLCLFLRKILGFTADFAYQPNHDIAAYGSALCKQIFAGIPLNYPLTAGRTYLPPWPRLRHAWSTLAEAVLAFLLCLSLIRRMSGDTSPFRRLAMGRTLAMALSFVILPPLLTCLSPRYQRELFWGVGQLPVYIEYHGFGLLLASILAAALHWLVHRPRTLGVAGLMASLLIAVELSFTGYFNKAIAQRWAPAWYTERQDVEKALAAGLADAVPEGATLIPAHRYPWWHDSFGAYFYCQNSGKKLRFSTSLQRGPGIPLIQCGTSGNVEHLPPSSHCYGLYDSRLDSRLACVFLCELNSDSGGLPGISAAQETRLGWLFVRNLHPNAEPFPMTCRITGTGAGSVRYVRLEDCKLVRQQRDWALYRFEIKDGCVDAQSLHVELVAGGTKS
ncbi:MAG TPA: hypothetical protein VKU02_20135 [Gemmataceae bacterium]|nr:hypothetical protein [Gemmataceae bacterium]